LTEPRLELRADPTVPLDECLVGIVTVTAGSQPVRVSARLNLLEGDLAVRVSGPAGHTARCAWPWPVDALGRSVDLEPGAQLVGAVPLIGSDVSTPLFPSPGPYTLVAEYQAAPGMALSSAAVTVRRTPGPNQVRVAALGDRDVIQSLVSASVLGGAGPGVRALADGTRVTTRVLAALALDQPDLVAAAATDRQAGAEVAAAVAAVLPPGVADTDPRRLAVLARLGDDGLLRP
jgi:hypothetical protein